MEILQHNNHEDGYSDSQQQNSNSVEKNIEIIDLTTNTSNDTLATTRIPNGCHDSLNKPILTNDSGHEEEIGEKFHENTEKISVNTKNLKESVTNNQIANTKIVSKENIVDSKKDVTEDVTMTSVLEYNVSDGAKQVAKENSTVSGKDIAEGDAKTSSDVLNQCSEVLNLCHDIEESVNVSEEDTIENLIVDKSEPPRTLNNSESQKVVHKSDKVSHNTIKKSPKNFKCTQLNTLERPQQKLDSLSSETCILISDIESQDNNTSLSKKLDETIVTENVNKKQEETTVIASSKVICEYAAAQSSICATNCGKPTEKIVFSVKRVDLSEEINCLDYTFESCDVKRSCAAAGDKETQLFASSNKLNKYTKKTTIQMENLISQSHDITSCNKIVKEPIITYTSTDNKIKILEASTSKSKVPLCQHNLPEDRNLNKEVTKLNSNIIEIEPEKEGSNEKGVTENKSCCQDLDEIKDLEKQPLFNTSNNVQTEKNVAISSCNDIEKDSKTVTNITKLNAANDDNVNNSNGVQSKLPLMLRESVYF